jgi:Icc-related predicted phosphoesterase
MIIYATVNIHGSPKRISLITNNINELKPDILVVAGDITNYTNAVSVITQLNDLPIPVLAIRGNTDLSRVENLLDIYPNTASLHFKQIARAGVHFTGIGGTIPVPFSSRICLKEKRALNKLESLMNNTTILVFHTPPRWARDEVMGRFSAGSKNLYEFVKKNQPNVVICGHIHEQTGITSIGKTLIVNCSISKHCSGALIEYQKGGRPKAKTIKRTDM